MKILEILLPQGTSDRSLSPQAARKIDVLQKRMDQYVDRIMNPNTSLKGKEFLKSRLRDDYHELRNTIPKVHAVAEDVQTTAPLQYEVYDRKTGEKVSGRGPYNSRARARLAVDNLDNKYGAYRYGYRPVGQKLEELFKGGKEWKLSFSGSEEYIAEFRAGEIDYTFHAYQPWASDEPGFWDVEFKVTNTDRPRRGEIDANAEHNKKFGITGTGNSAEVMSTVVDIMRSFLGQHKDITKLTFSAKESSRQKLYKAMISRLLPNWELSGDGIEYILTKPQNVISEAVHKLPLSDADFKLVKEVMSKPIPAAIAPIYISEIIIDDELNDTLFELENSDPGMDVRPIIAEWFNRVMPDQMRRFTDEVADKGQREGILSPIHGYDPHVYKSESEPVTGNAFGRR